MIEKICKNCKHWSDGDFWPSLIQNKFCVSPKIKYFETCKDEKIKDKDMGFHYHDDGCLARFETGPEFGCIHFEEKKNK